jgi:FlaA1/EpsC-like NDP-sugar epimerase
MGWSQIANTAASVGVTLAAGVFVVVYHLRAPWRTAAAGRHVMAFSAAVGLLGLYTVLISLWWPDGPAAAVLRVVRVALMVALAVLLVQRTVMMVRATARHEQDGDDR